MTNSGSDPTVKVLAAETVTTDEKPAGRYTVPLVTAVIILCGIILVAVFRNDINDYGVALLTRFGQGWVDVILFFVTALSCTPLMLPVWGYAVAGAAMGLSVVRLSAVMAFGSALGSYTTFAIGRYLSDRPWVMKRFPDLHKNRWTSGKSRLYVSLVLFFGTASPLPSDVVYAACGAKRYPTLPFLAIMVAARFVRYLYLGYGFLYFSDFF